MSISLILEKPKLESVFQGMVYRIMQGGKEIYRVMIGRERTEIRYKGSLLIFTPFLIL